jgi:hypothetical protein
MIESPMERFVKVFESCGVASAQPLVVILCKWDSETICVFPL